MSGRHYKYLMKNVGFSAKFMVKGM